jgi:hypothetical protein
MRGEGGGRIPLTDKEFIKSLKTRLSSLLPEVRIDTECWEWQGYIDPHGYGQMWGYERKREKAARVMWIMTFGPIPEGMDVCHKCDNRRCVNPFHLFVGTRRDNMQDASRKGKLSGPKRFFGRRK